MDFSKLIGRVRWATIRRKERKSREEAYRNRTFLIKAVGDEMWKAVYSNSSPLKWKAGFNKNGACMSFNAEHEGVQSDRYLLGLDEDNAYDFCRCDSDESMSYWTSEYFTAANIIAQIKAKDENPPDELIDTILTRYYEYKGINAAGQAFAWVLRLNSIVCDLFKTAPIFVEALSLLEQGANYKESYIKALETVVRPDLPICINSVASPGRHNMSYSCDGSCFYTIDHNGEAVCKEFPNERLDLSDYETMKRVAYTIVTDIRNGDESGLSDAEYMIKEEPEWKGDCIMPQKHNPTPVEIN